MSCCRLRRGKKLTCVIDKNVRLFVFWRILSLLRCEVWFRFLWTRIKISLNHSALRIIDHGKLFRGTTTDGQNMLVHGMFSLWQEKLTRVEACLHGQYLPSPPNLLGFYKSILFLFIAALHEYLDWAISISRHSMTWFSETMIGSDKSENNHYTGSALIMFISFLCWISGSKQWSIVESTFVPSYNHWKQVCMEMRGWKDQPMESG